MDFPTKSEIFEGVMDELSLIKNFPDHYQQSSIWLLIKSLSIWESHVFPAPIFFLQREMKRQ